MDDYHIHLHPHGPHTGDGPEPGVYPPGHIEEYVETAASRGVEELCFTEHLYRCHESAPVLGEFWRDEPRRDLAEQTRRFIQEDRTLSLEAYVEAVVSAKDRGLPVLLGLEVDFFPETIDAVLDLLEPYPWDLLVGAVHWIGGWSLDHPEAVHEYLRRGVRQVYEDYFALVTELAQSGTVDVLAHVDLPKVFGHRPDEAPIDLYLPVVVSAAASGTAVELNTSGLDGFAAELYPGREFLEMFHRAGVGVTFASDAHRPQDVWRQFGAALAIAREIGYETRLRFRKRAATVVPL